MRVMDYKDYINNNDIRYALKVLNDDLVKKRDSLSNGHWLSPQVDEHLKEIEYLESSIKRINNQFL